MLASARSWRPALVALLLTCAGLQSACTDPPEKEMHQAQGAIDAARAAGAAEYAQEEFQAAEAALTRSTKAVEERDYRQALNYALDARERAQNAAKSAAEARAHVRSEAERLLATTQDALTRARAAMATAADAKVPASALQAPSRAVNDAQGRVADAEKLLASSEYNKAKAALTGLTDGLTQAISQIDAETEARQSKRPARRSGK